MPERRRNIAGRTNHDVVEIQRTRIIVVMCQMVQGK